MNTNCLIRSMVMITISTMSTIGMAASQSANGTDRDAPKVIAELMKEEQGQATVFTAQLSAFRELAMSKPKEAVDVYFDGKAKSKWSCQIAPEMIDQQITDYFTGAMMLTGPQDAKSSIMALYNPWWDAVMLLKFDLKGTYDEPILRASDFYFISGETFRGEAEIKTNGVVKTLTVVPEADPLAVEIWRVVTATRQRFVDVFPIEGRVAWGKMATMLINVDSKVEMNRIQTRSAVRLTLTLTFLKNARDVGIASHITRLIRSGNELQLMTYFREPNTRPLTRLFAQVPEIFRRDFTPYGYVPTERATLYVFVNKKVPRLFVTVTLMKKITSKTSSMEWYDLMQSDKLLSSWNNRKESSK